MPISLNTISSGYNLSAINDNFTKLAAELDDNVLKRDGLDTGEGNEMDNDLDMNGYSIINAKVGGSDLTDLASDAATSAASAAVSAASASADATVATAAALSADSAETNAKSYASSANSDRVFAAAAKVQAEEAADEASASAVAAAASASRAETLVNLTEDDVLSSDEVEEIISDYLDTDSGATDVIEAIKGSTLNEQIANFSSQEVSNPNLFTYAQLSGQDLPDTGLGEISVDKYSDYNVINIVHDTTTTYVEGFHYAAWEVELDYALTASQMTFSFVPHLSSTYEDYLYVFMYSYDASDNIVGTTVKTITDWTAGETVSLTGSVYDNTVKVKAYLRPNTLSSTELFAFHSICLHEGSSTLFRAPMSEDTTLTGSEIIELVQEDLLPEQISDHNARTASNPNLMPIAQILGEELPTETDAPVTRVKGDDYNLITVTKGTGNSNKITYSFDLDYALAGEVITFSVTAGEVLDSNIILGLKINQYDSDGILTSSKSKTEYSFAEGDRLYVTDETADDTSSIYVDIEAVNFDDEGDVYSFHSPCVNEGFDTLFRMPLASSSTTTTSSSSSVDVDSAVEDYIASATGQAALVAAINAALGSTDWQEGVAVDEGDTTAPVFTSSSIATAIAENTGSGQVVYTATTTDDSDVTYSINNTKFSIDTDTGAVTLIGNPDYETQQSYSFTVTATDSEGNSASRTVLLSITDDESDNEVTYTLSYAPTTVFDFDSATSLQASFDNAYSQSTDATPIFDTDNETDGFSFTQNEVLYFYDDMYALTGDTDWIDRMVTTIDYIFDNTDVRRVEKGELTIASWDGTGTKPTNAYFAAPYPHIVDGTPVEGWSSYNGTGGTTYLRCQILTDGQILAAIATCCDTILDDSSLLAYHDTATGYLNGCATVLEDHQTTYQTKTFYDYQDTYGTVDVSAYYYANTSGASSVFSTVLAFNHSLGAHLCAMVLDKHDITSDYLPQAQAWLDFMRSDLCRSEFTNDDGLECYSWKYTVDTGADTDEIEDLNHGGFYMGPVWKFAYENGYLDFTTEEITKYANTLYNAKLDDGTVAYRYSDTTTALDDDYIWYVGHQYWLSVFNNDIASWVTDNMDRVHDTATTPAMFHAYSHALRAREVGVKLQ